MNEQDPQYKPGDVANGHVLTESGQWLPVGSPTPPEGPTAKKPIYKRWWFITIAALFVIGMISSAAGGEEPSTPASSAASSAPAQDEPKADEPKADKPKADEPKADEPKEEPARNQSPRRRSTSKWTPAP